MKIKSFESQKLVKILDKFLSFVILIIANTTRPVSFGNTAGF